ncbi:MAG: tetratricopeptide repeat protein, partial [Pirellulaceae bacterium]|nr:tetratricopeptide repeat protein [Pirellulaceae bacterium]
LGRDTVSYLTFSRRGPGFTPSWSISGNRLIVSAFPQNIYGLLNRPPMPPSKAIVARLQERDSFLFIKIREKDVAQLAYPLVELVAAQLPAEMPNDVAQWIEVDPGALPSLPAITDHLDNATITCNVTDGLEIVRHQTLPPSGASLLAVIGMMSDEFSRTFQSALSDLNPIQANQNRMKQVALALHNYHDAHRAFPAAVPQDDTVNSMLSWRVQILPFLEEYELYEQFRHDEPWDSPHNRQLIQRMPDVYRLSESTAGSGRTTLLAVRNRDGVFPGPTAIVIEDIIDGTSNTLLFAEANDDRAIPWTKPDDLQFGGDEKNIAAALKRHERGFLVALADGSVRLIRSDFGNENWFKLIRRNDGRSIQWELETEPAVEAAIEPPVETDPSSETTKMASEALDLSGLGQGVPSLDPSSPLMVDSQIEQAKKLAEAGRHFDAIVLFAEITIRDPDNAEAHLGLGNSFYETKQYKKSEEAFAKAVSLAPENAKGHFAFGKAIWIQDRNEESIVEFKKAIELAPDYADAWLFLGLAHNSLRQSDNAIKALSRSVELDNKRWFAFYTRAGIHFNAHRYNEALADYSRVLQLRPSESDAHYYRGLVHHSLEQFDQAIDDFSARIAANPLDARAIRSRAAAYSDARKLPQAIRDYNALIGIDSDDADAWQDRAGCWLNLSKYDAAIRDYTEAIQRRPDQYAFTNRAICWENKNDFSKAADDYNKAIEIDPNYVFALDARAYAYMTLRKYAQSKSSYAAAIDVAGETDERTLGNYSWLLAACPDDAVRDGKLALKYATKACELTDWKEAWIIDNVAAAHAELGAFDKAIELAQLAIKTSDSQADRDDIQTRLNLYKQNQPARIK